MKRRVYVIDFETESYASIKDLGAYAYACHPTTDVMCRAWRHVDGAPGTERLWLPDDPIPQELIEADELWAFNAFFEWCIWEEVLVKRYGWPPVKNLWCLAALAANYGYSQNLDRCASGMNLRVSKDTDGHKVMMALCNPSKRSKKTKENYQELCLRLYEYCKTDVNVSALIYKTLPPMPPSEKEIWLVDQIINREGIPFDVDLVDAAVDCVDQIQKNAALSLTRMTDKRITTPNQVKRIVEFAQERGVKIKDLKAATVDKLLKRKSVPKDIKKILEIRKVAGTAAIKKYNCMKEQIIGERVRGLFRYYGAHTGRWTGQGVQPSNMPRMHFDNEAETERAIEAVKSKDLANVAALDPKNPTDVLTKCVRPSITAPAGKTFVCGDFSGIEPRVLMWLADEKEAMKEIVERGSSALYLDLACKVFGREIKQSDTFEYTTGKAGFIGAGYQMGPYKKDKEGKPKLEEGKPFGGFIEYASGYGVDVSTEFADKTIDAYRQKYPVVVKSWYAVSRCVKRVLKTGDPARWRSIGFRRDGRSLVITLPSGRELWYADAAIEYNKKRGYETVVYWGDKKKKWCKLFLYGGLIIENIVQAIARDLLCYSMIMNVNQGYTIVSHCYDEIVDEVDESKADQCYRDLMIAMTTVPDWADGLVLNADLWVGKRYKK